MSDQLNSLALSEGRRRNCVIYITSGCRVVMPAAPGSCDGALAAITGQFLKSIIGHDHDVPALAREHPPSGEVAQEAGYGFPGCPDEFRPLTTIEGKGQADPLRRWYSMVMGQSDQAPGQPHIDRLRRGLVHVLNEQSGFMAHRIQERGCELRFPFLQPGQRLSIEASDLTGGEGFAGHAAGRMDSKASHVEQGAGRLFCGQQPDDPRGSVMHSDGELHESLAEHIRRRRRRAFLEQNGTGRNRLEAPVLKKECPSR